MTIISIGFLSKDNGRAVQSFIEVVYKEKILVNILFS
jgi:hypothetical protein